MVEVTDSAVAKVKDLQVAEGREGAALRVYVEGGGCSGFQYGLEFVDDDQDDDLVIEKGGVRVLIDPMSATYLEGARLDYLNGLAASGFKVTNPNAKSTCGCGQSFGV